MTQLVRPSLEVLVEHDDFLRRMTGLDCSWVRAAIEKTYDTLDLIDEQLLAKGAQPLRHIVELANLSSMLGNLLAGGLAAASDGRYERNRPHAYPDLLPQRSGLWPLEIKTALETNRPKGHLPKVGAHLTFRYVLGDRAGTLQPGRDGRGDTIWIWEVRVGHLTARDYQISNTAGDSGKTAVIKTETFQCMPRLLYVPALNPYRRRNAWYGDSPVPPVFDLPDPGIPS